MRRSRDVVLMDAAYVFSTRSTCSRASVGAVIAVDGRIISTGYNGAPSGMPHCDHTCVCNGAGIPPRAVPIDGHAPGCMAIVPCDVTVHAEANAVAFAARYGTPTMDATLYTTTGPCVGCAKLIINAGLVRVVYGAEYRDSTGIHLLLQAGVEIDLVGS